MTPAETKTKLDHLITKLVRFEKYIDEDAAMEIVLPYIYQKFEKRYQNYTIRQLCQELHDFCKAKKINVLQKKMFLKNISLRTSFLRRKRTGRWCGARGSWCL